MASIHRLILVFREVRALLSQPENDFSYSGWDDANEALKEIDPLFESLNRGSLERTQTMNFLFLPTGPLQEVSLSSGWGDKFVYLADRFEEALAEDECSCYVLPQVPELKYDDRGTTQNHVDLSLAKCPQCGQYWLHCFYEHEAFTASGRWFLGALADWQAASLDTQNAIPFMESLDWYWCGGSYFKGIGLPSGEINL